MAQVMVTGGAGFIGTHLAASLIEDGHHVTVLDNWDPFYDTRIKQRNLDHLTEVNATTDGGFTFVRDDIRNRDTLDEHMADIDFVFHEAAKAGVGPSVDDPLGYEETNIEGTLNVLEAALDNDVERVINASSSSVYGDVQLLPTPEEHRTEPKSPYAATKLATEHYTRLYDELYDLNTVSIRYFTVYGPRMRPGMAITDFTARAVDPDAEFTRLGSGQQTRDFTHVDDIVWANKQLMYTSVADGEVLNIGSGGNVSVNGLIDTVQDAVGVDKEITQLPSRDGDSWHTHADISKATRLLGYSPETNIEDGVRGFVEWYEANDWYHELALEEAT